MHNWVRKEPSEALLIGRRSLEALPGIELIQDYCWDPLFSKWVLFASITVTVERDTQVPAQTKWYIHVDDRYPLGEIEFFPSNEGGLTLTFPHQNYNGDIEENRPWRKGKICLDSMIRVLGRIGEELEPRDQESRLYWHFERAKAWLYAASLNSLRTKGDPFELPHFKTNTTSVVAFSESPTTYATWNDNRFTYGLVDFITLKDNPAISVIKSFKALNGMEVHKPNWGKAFTEGNVSTTGLWIRLNDVPVVTPWQVPMNWFELSLVCNSFGVNLLKTIEKSAHFFRDGRHHYVLLGFPIPEKIGDPPSIICWQAFQLPILSRGNQLTKGFRKGEKGYWFRDITQVLRGSERITWIHSENWHRNEIFNRGKLPAAITNASILQIGVGALGSVVAEQLVRADAQKLTLMDGDILNIGNITRHTLGVFDLKENKAHAVAKRLNLSEPHSKVHSISWDLSWDSDELLNQYQVIFDCTGEDEVLYKLEDVTWEKSKNFISASLGFGAKRLFIFSQKGVTFSATSFFRLMKPWLEIERKSYDIDDMPREGIGCWHPIFPARIDDIWVMSGIVIKNIERFIQSSVSKPTLLVYEQNWQDGLFQGVKLIHQEYES